MLKCNLIFTVLLVIILGTSALASDGVLKLFIGGKEIPAKIAPTLLDGDIYVPLGIFGYMGAEAKTDNKQKKDGQKVWIIRHDGGKFMCRARVVKNELMLPLAELSPEMDVNIDYDEELRVVSIQAKIKRVEFDGSRLRVVSSYPVSYTILDTPWTRSVNKFILDINGAQFPAKKSDLQVENPTQISIDTGVHDNGNMARLVMDMPGPTVYKITSKPLASEITVETSIRATKNAQDTASPNKKAPEPELPPVVINDINWRKDGSQGLEVNLDISGPAKYMPYLLREPDRLVVDISKATLAREFSEIAVDQSILQAIRCAQKDEDTVRIVMDLSSVACYELEQDNSGKLTISIELPKGAGGLLANKVIVIDPGHGGSQPGAPGYSGTYEKVHTLAIGSLVQKLLKDAGVCALMTRKGDTTLGLQERVQFAARNSADLFVSIHCNSSGAINSLTGTETFYHGGDISGQALAQCIQPEIVKAIGIRDLSIKADTQRFKTGFAVLRGSSACGLPAVLIEVGFINHAADEAKIKDPSIQRKIAEGIVRGLKTYVEGNPGSGNKKTEALEPRVASNPDRALPISKSVAKPSDANTKPVDNAGLGPKRPGERSK